MSDVLLLLWPKWRSAVNNSTRGREGTKNLLIAGLAVLFCGAIFLTFYYLFNYIEHLDFTGPNTELESFLRFEINRRIVGMVVLVFLGILVFSNVITALTTFFLSDDLDLVAPLPVSGDSLFIARFLEMLLDSSWMIVIFGAPVFLAFGVVYGAGGWYYAAIPGVIIPFILIPAGLGVMVTMVLVYSFPARRIRDILLLLMVLAAGLLFVLLRLLQPEKLVNPDVTMEVLDFIRSIQAPEKMWMPNYWAASIFSELARGPLSEMGLRHLGLLWSTGLGITALALVLARFIYFESFSKSQEATRTVISRTGPVNRLVGLVSSPFSLATRQMVMKDLRVFMRDTSQWSQLFLLAALMVIYIMNYYILSGEPLSRFARAQFRIQNAISYLNIGLAGFVLAALCARFTFPMVSQEGKAFWIVKSSPLSLRGFLWSKFLISAVPLLAIGVFLISVTNYILKVSPTVWRLGLVTIVLMTLAICGMGVGLGARFPRFNQENPAKVATSFGGVVYMILTMTVIGTVVALEATPTYYYFMYQWRGMALSTGEYALIVGSLAAAAGLLIAATLIPMRVGLDWLSRLEV